jgi:hypothetical protein
MLAENLSSLFRGSSPPQLLGQFAILVAFVLLLVYLIVLSRRKTVVILSHPRLILAALVISALNVAFFQAVLWLDPEREHRTIVLICFIVWCAMLNIPAYLVAGETTLQDTVLPPTHFVNCNWPLIRRMAIGSMLFPLGFGYFWGG